jgi:hypothetical protein
LFKKFLIGKVAPAGLISHYVGGYRLLNVTCHQQATICAQEQFVTRAATAVSTANQNDLQPLLIPMETQILVMATIN